MAEPGQSVSFLTLLGIGGVFLIHCTLLYYLLCLALDLPPFFLSPSPFFLLVSDRQNLEDRDR